jgi:transcriptional regulator with XRE-family HTH domain
MLYHLDNRRRAGAGTVAPDRQKEDTPTDGGGIEMKTAFGAYFRELRARLKLPLRQFCLANKYDAGNISKLERGVVAAPSSDEKLREYARALKIKRGTEAWERFFDLASLSRREIPQDIMGDAELVRRLPLFFRTLRGQKVGDTQLDALADKIRKS